MNGHPAPEQRAIAVERTDDRVPRDARFIAKLAGAQGWSVVIHYARGTDLLEGGKTGGQVESVVVRLRRDDDALVAVWLSRDRRVCPGCAKALLPTETGRFPQHEIAGRGSGVCDSSGQAALFTKRAGRKYELTSAYGRDTGKIGQDDMKTYVKRQNGEQQP